MIIAGQDEADERARFSPSTATAPLLPPLALFGAGPTAHEYELALPENLAALLDMT